MTRRDPTLLLPLKPNWMHILLTLSDAPRHGYSIMQEVQERTGGKIKLWPATLYGTIRRLEDEDLVAPVDFAEPGDDERRQYYAITGFGRHVLSAEVKRLEELVRLAYAKGAAGA
jgi:DNA-binding PadR family transcriptional regulator